MTINGTQAIEMPEKGSHIKFQNHQKQLSVPFVIYADFEAITEKIQGCRPNEDKSYTESYQNHKDCGYEYRVVSCYGDKYIKPVQINKGGKSVYNFMEKCYKNLVLRWCSLPMKKTSITH